MLIASKNGLGMDIISIMVTDIMAMDVKTRKTRRLTPRTEALAKHVFDSPRYSADGKFLALLGTDLTQRHNEQSRNYSLPCWHSKY